MTNRDVVNDLQALIEFFKENNDDCYPVCLEKAIEIIEKIEQKEEA